jgi:hypothetical protein
MILSFENFVNEAFGDKHPKNVYANIQRRELQNYEDELFNLIQTAYSQKGGNLEIKKPSDIPNSDLTYWVAADKDSDPEADILIAGKKKNHGTKITVIGQDGTSEARREAVKKIIELMKTRGFYAEMDLDLADKMGLKLIDNEDKIREIIQKPDIKFIGKGLYIRDIAGQKKEKVLVGLPK